MSNEYSIAVLLPTRGRTDPLRVSVMSLIDYADDVSSLQIMFGFDKDDAVGLEYFTSTLQPELDQLEVDYVAMTFAPMGYIRINEYGNELARNASADWTFFWNDDAIMETRGWDSKIRAHDGEFKLLAVRTHRDHPNSIFPIVPDAWLKLFNYLSPHQLIDTWVSQQAYMLDIMERLDINVLHDRHDITGNNQDATFKGRVQAEGNPSHPGDFSHATWAQRRLNETEAISQYMASQGLDTTWWNNVKAGTQDPWVKLRASDPNKQMMASWNVPK